MYHMKKKYIIVGIIVAVLGVFLINLVTVRNEDNSPVVIGVLTPLTGFAAEHGQLIKNGIELARKNSPQNNISVVYEDSACDSKAAISAYNKLVTQDKVKTIIGLVCSSEALAISPLAERDGIIIVAAGASSPAVTAAGENIFRVYPSDKEDADLISKYILTNNFSKVALISVNNDYGDAINSQIVANIGNKIIQNEKFSIAQADFRLMLTKAKGNSDLIVFVGYPNNTPIFLKQKLELGLGQEVIGSAASFTTSLFEMDKKVSSNFVFTSPDISPSGSSIFRTAYEVAYNSKPQFPAEYGYDVFLATMEMLKSGRSDVSTMKKALYSMDIVGATGDIKFDKNGDREGVELRVYRLDENKNLSCYFNCQS
jgi:branched-chain amino acid transport system substrate-binding protein